MIRFLCPKCGLVLKAVERNAGEVVVCSNCKTQIKVPSKAPKSSPAKPIKATKEKAANLDRRVSPRHPVNQVHIELTSVLEDSRSFVGWLLDYSNLGVGLLMDARLPSGTYVSICPALASGDTIEKEAVVKHCRKHPDGWRIGCKLEKPFTKEELKMFGLA